MNTSALDVPKDSIFCAIYDGKSYPIVKDFSMTTVSIRSMSEYLKSENVKLVTMESSTSIWDTMLEEDFDLNLVNPLHIKQMPDRKSNAKDDTIQSVLTQQPL
jgi:hypothetical protein